eukprot:751670-Hanusia_phi.AAC.4
MELEGADGLSIEQTTFHKGPGSSSDKNVLNRPRGKTISLDRDSVGSLEILLDVRTDPAHPTVTS